MGEERFQKEHYPACFEVFHLSDIERSNDPRKIRFRSIQGPDGGDGSQA
jgi:hypothetical protein